MNELSAALRHFADQVEAGAVLADPTQCAIVLMNEANEAQAIYMGMQPAGVTTAKAGIFLLAAGIQRFNVGELASEPMALAAVGTEAISIFEDHA